MRGTGQTKRMLLRAVTKFLEEKDVVVTAWNINYSRDLCRQCKEILYSLRLDDKIDLDMTGRIRYHDKIMWFTSHENYTKYVKESGPYRWEHCPDHYYPYIINDSFLGV